MNSCGSGLDSAVLGGNFASGIDNPLFQILLVRKRLLESMLVIARINLEQEITLPYEGVVLDRQGNQTPAYLRRDRDEVCSDTRIVCSGMAVRIVDNDQQCHH